MRILYVSQIASPDHPRRARLPDEKQLRPPVFAALGVELHVVDATCEQLPDPRPYAGVVVGGSAGSVHDGEPWRLRLRQWMLDWQQVPLLAVCGGHQLLAHALGSRVAKMSRPQVGVYPLELSGVPGWTGRVVQLHFEHVVDVPPGASVWAEDPAGIQALRYPGHQRWAVQFHPEGTEDDAFTAGRSMGATDETWPPGEVREAIVSSTALLRAWLDGLR